MITLTTQKLPDVKTSFILRKLECFYRDVCKSAVGLMAAIDADQSVSYAEEFEMAPRDGLESPA